MGGWVCSRLKQHPKNPEGETGGVEGPSLCEVNHFLDLIFNPVIETIFNSTEFLLMAVSSSRQMP